MYGINLWFCCIDFDTFFSKYVLCESINQQNYSKYNEYNLNWGCPVALTHPSMYPLFWHQGVNYVLKMRHELWLNVRTRYYAFFFGTQVVYDAVNPFWKQDFLFPWYISWCLSDWVLLIGFFLLYFCSLTWMMIRLVAGLLTDDAWWKIAACYYGHHADITYNRDHSTVESGTEHHWVS